jgi:hypothetical protein
MKCCMEANPKKGLSLYIEIKYTSMHELYSMKSSIWVGLGLRFLERHIGCVYYI